LTGELVVRAERAGSIPRLAEGFVERGGGLDSARVRRNRRTAEVVSEQVGQRPVRADGESGRAREVILGDRCPLFLVVLTNIIRGHAVDDGFDLFPIRIVVEVGRRRAGH
jgi:hypothetical protein